MKRNFRTRAESGLYHKPSIPSPVAILLMSLHELDQSSAFTKRIGLSNFNLDQYLTIRYFSIITRSHENVWHSP
jgi:hypothetical protein